MDVVSPRFPGLGPPHPESRGSEEGPANARLLVHGLEIRPGGRGRRWEKV